MDTSAGEDEFVTDTKDEVRDYEDEQSDDDEEGETDDDATESDEDVGIVTSFQPKRKVDPTQRRISETIMAYKTFPDQVVFKYKDLQLRRGFIYDSFKAKGQVDHEVRLLPSSVMYTLSV